MSFRTVVRASIGDLAIDAPPDPHGCLHRVEPQAFRRTFLDAVGQQPHEAAPGQEAGGGHEQEGNDPRKRKHSLSGWWMVDRGYQRYPESRIQNPELTNQRPLISEIRYRAPTIGYQRNQTTRSVWRDTSHCAKAASDFALRHCSAASQPFRATATPQRV